MNLSSLLFLVVSITVLLVAFGTAPTTVAEPQSALGLRGSVPDTSNVRRPGSGGDPQQQAVVLTRPIKGPRVKLPDQLPQQQSQPQQPQGVVAPDSGADTIRGANIDELVAEQRERQRQSQQTVGDLDQGGRVLTGGESPAEIEDPVQNPAPVVQPQIPPLGLPRNLGPLQSGRISVFEVNDTASVVRHKKLPEYKRWPIMGDLDCSRVLAGEQTYIRERARNRLYLGNESLTDWPVDCKSIRARTFFNMEPGSAEEAEFPLAFARNVFKDFPFIEAELGANYAPQNWYCYAIDARSPPLFKQRLRSLASCFPNVIVNEQSFYLDSMGHNQTASLYECLRNLAQPDKKWKYLLVLQNHDVQMKTNEELVQIFKWLNGANDVSIRNVGFVEGFLNKSVDWSFDGLGLIKNATLREQIRQKGGPQSIQFAKSYYQGSLSREFVDFTLEQLDVSKFMRELDDGACFVDEFLIPSLVSTDALEAPGGYTHECIQRGHAAIQLTRFNIYTCNAADSAECVPNPRCRNPHQARHGVCPLSIEDLAPNLKNSHALFYNKAMPDFDLGGVLCWHETMFNRTHLDRGVHRLTPYVYKQFPQTRYQSYKELRRNASLSGQKIPRFDCLYRIPIEDKLQLFDADGKSGWRIFNHVRRYVSIHETSKFTAWSPWECYGRHSTYHLKNTGGYVWDPLKRRGFLKGGPGAVAGAPVVGGGQNAAPPEKTDMGTTEALTGVVGGKPVVVVPGASASPSGAFSEEDLPDFLENGESIW